MRSPTIGNSAMNVRAEWGVRGLRDLIPETSVFIVVDVLSFSTAVDVACAARASVLPFPFGDPTRALAEAERHGCLLAGRRRDPESIYSLSPPTLRKLPAGSRLLLPSPNGSTISFAAEGKPVLAGCFRNARAVAHKAMEIADGGVISVIPAGEHWPDSGLRPAIEDMLGAGCILSELNGQMDAEAQTLQTVYMAARSNLAELVQTSRSGRELDAMGFPQDVAAALEQEVSDIAPLLTDGIFRGIRTGA